MLNTFFTTLSILALVVGICVNTTFGSAADILLSEKKAEILVSQAQDVQFAANLFIKFECSIPTKISDIAGEYISSIPDIPISTDGSTWTLANAKDRYNKTVGIVTVELPFGATTEKGITKDICKAVNKNSADLVFCTVSKTGFFNEKNLTAGEGSDDLLVDSINDKSSISRAKIHMII